jgi:hypothetical protein
LKTNEAQRLIQERMMFPTAEQFESMGYRPSVRSDLDRMRDFRSRLKDNDSIEDFVRELENEGVGLTHMAITHEASALMRRVRNYKAQSGVSSFLNELRESRVSLSGNRFFDEIDSLLDRMSITPPPKFEPEKAALFKEFSDELFSGGMKRGDLFILGARPDPYRKSMLMWEITTPKGVEHLTINQIKKRSDEGKAYTLHYDFEANVLRDMTGAEKGGPNDLHAATKLAFEALAWSPSSNIQSQSRLRRRAYVNAIKLPGAYASRNEREGVYNFKVKGRHTRKRRAPKIVTLGFDHDVLKQLTKSNPTRPIPTPDL